MALFLQKIRSLWKELGIPEEEQEAFLRTISNSPKDYTLVRRLPSLPARSSLIPIVLVKQRILATATYLAS